MATIQPKGELLKRAVKWISEKRKQDPECNLSRLVDEAGFQFDLSPKDSEFLLRMVKDEQD